jgi:hypothetical protein
MSEPCRRCGGTEHYESEITDSSDSGLNLLSPGIFRTGKLRAKVCGTCGLVDLSVPERFMKSIREQFERVP